MTLPDLTISRILHAGYVFACGATRIAFDTIFENPFSHNCHAFPDVRFDPAQIRAQRFDAVFISHFHDDHCSLDSLDLLDRATPLYVYCLLEELFAMLRQLGFTQVHALGLNQPVTVGPFCVTPREAMDAEVDAMFQISAAGMNVLNVVDAWIDAPTLAQLVAAGPWDMVLWPFQTMREIEVLAPAHAAPAPPGLPAHWIAQLRALAPRFVVPSSCQFVQEAWSWQRQAFFPVSYAQFARELAAALPGVQVRRLEPSVSVRLDAHGLHPAPPLPWVLPVGPQDVDYAYAADAPAPPTSAVARHFPALTPEARARVDRYCHDELAQQLADTEAGSDYFDTARIWRLSVWDHAGAGTHWHYRLLPDGSAQHDASGAAPAWTTDIPAAKLYAALEQGESLTSAYLRINDGPFDAATTLALQDADIVDDPLIRCLFSHSFGAYQAVQLRRLLAR